MLGSRTKSKAKVLMKLLVAASFSLFAPSVEAQGFWERTSLFDLSLGSSRSDIATNFARGGYELSDGTTVDFSKWYTARFPDLNIKFLTSFGENFGLIWGLSTGEIGEKFRIDQGLWLGFIYQYQLNNQSEWTLSVMSMLGGDFSERDCVGDWPEFGGRQRVNCRLAATPLPPRDTLNFLVRERGFRETRATLRYQIRF